MRGWHEGGKCCRSNTQCADMLAERLNLRFQEQMSIVAVASARDRLHPMPTHIVGQEGLESDGQLIIERLVAICKGKQLLQLLCIHPCRRQVGRLCSGSVGSNEAPPETMSVAAAHLQELL